MDISFILACNNRRWFSSFTFTYAFFLLKSLLLCATVTGGNIPTCNLTNAIFLSSLVGTSLVCGSFLVDVQNSCTEDGVKIQDVSQMVNFLKKLVNSTRIGFFIGPSYGLQFYDELELIVLKNTT